MRPKSRKKAKEEYLQVVVTIKCPKGHAVGAALKHVPPSSRRGYRLYTMSMTDTSSGGVLQALCPQCAADVQVRWERVRRRLDAKHDAREPESSFSPDTPDAGP